MNTIHNHKQMASQCFNKVWDFLEMPERTREEEEQMIHLAHTSFWHWTQVEEHTPTNISIGYWQLSRVYAVVGNGEQALYYGNRCVGVSLEANIPPFYIGYGYEAVARANQILNKSQDAKEAYLKALEYVELVVVEESKKLLMKDLEEIKEKLF